MKLTIGSLVAAVGLLGRLGSAVPLAAKSFSEKYIVPLPESDIFYKTFQVINNDTNSGAKAPVTSLISIAISTDNTILYIDHWEDGYELDPTNPVKATTEIWGDGNAANGCVYGRPCTNAGDVLKAGNSIVIENFVPMPRDPKVILYDGGDLIVATYPVAVTRGCYPSKPGSLMAGAVEVFDISKWGYDYQSPLGPNSFSETSAFEYTALYIMAAEDQTEVTLPDTTKVILNQGQSSIVRLTKEGQKIKANKQIQVDLLTGDIGSTYELRWFSLLPVTDWSNSYVTPMGDSAGKTLVYLFNPSNSFITVTCTMRGGITKTFPVPPQASTRTDVIPTGIAALFTSPSKFSALSATDTGKVDGKNITTVGQHYDWGFPLMTRESLSTQVLIGWGYGATFKNCTGFSRTQVFITTMEDADVYIDYNNDGVVDRTIFNFALQSANISDPDLDMSGAIIYATLRGTGQGGRAVTMAAAWGQNAAVTNGSDTCALDLGTVVIPFPELRATKQAELVNDVNGDGLFSPGDKIRYTIRLVNVGQRDMSAGSLRIIDPLLNQMTYLSGTSNYVYGTNSRVIPDDRNGTAFPLDGTGITTYFVLPRRGGTHEISFDAIIADATTLRSTDLTNSGFIDQGVGAPIIPFSSKDTIALSPAVSIQKTVYLGQDGKKSCGTTSAVEQVEGQLNTKVTYCFRVTNTGTTFLRIPSVSDPSLPYTTDSVGQLAPGASTTVAYETTIGKDLTSPATVIGKPIFSNWAPIDGLADVTASDPAGVKLVPFAPAISIAKTVYAGDKGTSGCSGSVELVTGVYSSLATYCYKVTNTGKEFLALVAVNDPAVGFTDKSIGTLAPGASALLKFVSPILEDIATVAEAIGNPVYADGTDIESLTDVKATDPAGVKVIYNAKISVQKTVYVGDKGSAGCSIATESVTAPYGTKVTYCFTVTNAGPTHLGSVSLKDAGVEYSNTAVGSLAPAESKTLTFLSSVVKEVKSMVVAVGNPTHKDGKDIASLADVTAQDGAGVIPVYNPSVVIEKTVKLGIHDESSCYGNTKELVTAPAGSDVTYCYQVKNTGFTFLSSVVVDDIPLSYRNTSLPIIPPNQDAWLAFPTKLTKELKSTASVVAVPVFTNGGVIPNLSTVTDTDDAGVNVMQFPAIDIEKKVKTGHYGPEACADAKEEVRGMKGAFVTYCYTVTNIGTTPLKSITVSDPLPFNGSIEPLQPGKSLTIVYQTTITGNVLTTATATGIPADKAGVALAGYSPVTATDDAGVKARDLQLAVERPTNCLQPAYTDADEEDTLICGKMDVYFIPTSVVPATPTTCEDGSDVVLSLKATLHAIASRYDVGWYVALDGGDALTGTCDLSVLKNGNNYAVTADGSSRSVGAVSWTNDKFGGNDECGDILLNPTAAAGGNILVNVAVDKTFKCVDTNGDGNLDFSVCFSWREDVTDELCTFRIDDPNRRGSLPDVYPAVKMACFCTTYEVPGVKVVTLDPEEPC